MEIKLHYIEKGKGFPLVLLHGNGEDLTYFENQIGFFSKYYHVIAIDTRGHGASPRGTAPFTLAQFSDDLKAFLDEMAIGKAHILGFSDGGNIALLFALKYPQMVEKLVLNGVDLSTAGVKPTVQLPIELAYRLTAFISRFDQKATSKKEMLGLMVGQPNIRPDELAALSMPVLVIAGTCDMIKESHTRMIADSLPNAALYIMEGIHFIANEHSAPFNGRVLAFLK